MPTLSDLSDLSDADRHRAVADHFAGIAAQVGDWSAPSPVADWSAADVVAHLTSWFPAFLTGVGGPELPVGTGDPIADWERQSAAVDALLRDPATAERRLDHPHAGGGTLSEMVDRIYTSDVFLHTWDLARAAGVPAGLEPAYCARLLAGMRSHEAALRTSGHYGPPVAVAPDADPPTALLAFIGRDPHWTPA